MSGKFVGSRAWGCPAGPHPRLAPPERNERHYRTILAPSGFRPINNALIDGMARTAWSPTGTSDADRGRQLFVAVKGLQAFAPADEIEAMIAAQAMAAHHASMECSRRAMIPDQH